MTPQWDFPPYAQEYWFTRSASTEWKVEYSIIGVEVLLPPHPPLNLHTRHWIYNQGYKLVAQLIAEHS